MKTKIEINVMLNNVLQTLSFAEIEKMTKGNSAFKKFYCYCKFGILRSGNEPEIFAQDFITYHPDYAGKTFKLILEMGTAKLIEIVNNENIQSHGKSNQTGTVASHYA